MANQKRGRQSFLLSDPPVITHWASVAGKKESEGPLAHTFDIKSQDTYFGQKTWEQGEKQMQKLALGKLAEKANMKLEDFDLVFSGDLLNQCIGSSFTLRNLGIPHLGLYGACSTMAESLLLSSMAVGGGFADNAVAMTSSHFASSERQYRFPLGYGGQRTPTAQWTVTGSGAALVRRDGHGPRITGCTVGTVTDLGQLGKEMLLELARRDGVSLGGKLTDCGTMVFDNDKQDVHAGGSGCGCSAITLCGYLLGQLNGGKLKKILFCGTGALLSPTSTQQGLPIPGVCHAVCIAGGT